ncbi:MAG: effector-associated constant component EACC1 [Pseudonocardiaceae bacterium]
MASGTVSIDLDCSDDELRSLAKWLRDEDELRGRVSLVPRPIEPGELGAALDTVQVAITSGTVGTLVTSLFAWLTHRRLTKKIFLKFHTDQGHEITLTCGSADDVSHVLDHVRILIADGS